MNFLDTEKSILRVLAYFDMFHYPLTNTDIHLFLDQPTSTGEIQTVLNKLTAKKGIYSLGGFYSLQNEPSLAERRINGTQRAERLLPVAYRIGRLLGKFPFVRGVGISGSLSKNFADEHADIDFFIITKANRLWIARSLLHCLKKISYLFGKQHWYCMNYFIDEEALAMPEQNRFIATELLTLKPISGSAFHEFFAVNDWALDQFPNHVFADCPVQAKKTKWIEYLFDNKIGDLLDIRLMRITRGRWLRKERKCKTNMKGGPMSIRIDRHYARPNPDHFQKKILDLYAVRLQEIEKISVNKGMPKFENQIT